MAEPQQYLLSIDGKMLRDQRRLLDQWTAVVPHGQPLVAEPGDQELLQGIVALLDAIADQAHDQYGIDCLLVEEPCKC
jgi:hypothetical protein